MNYLILPYSITMALCLCFSAEAVDFVKDIKPIFEGACVQCHNSEKAKKEGAEYNMQTRAGAFAGGQTYGKDVIRPKDAGDSPVWWMTTVHLDDDFDPKDPEAMPPKRPLSKRQSNLIMAWIDAGAHWPDGIELTDQPRVTFQNVRKLLIKGGPFSDRQIQTLRLWTAQGADWPEGVKLGGGSEIGDNLTLVKQIRSLIVATTKESSEGEMGNYTSKLSKKDADFDMIAIKGGEFTMGSPESEQGRFPDEGPQHKVNVEPFWMGKHEVTWNLYKPFMDSAVPRNKDGSPQRITGEMENIDIISRPTTPYSEMSFGMGTNGYPAVCMTQHGANKFCEWLSAQTGHFYRLPTEAEWEYACRAGSSGPFSCPADKLSEYAILDPDQVRSGYEKVGTKKPNPWGLYDMHGNVMEWVIDQYASDTYSKRTGPVSTPISWPTQRYPRIARGGSWYDPPEELRSARRFFSEENWKAQDPQFPRSIWFHTEATWLGFRIVRPLKVPEAKEMERYWNIGVAGE